MNIFLQFLYGMIVVGVAFVMLKFNYQLVGLTGRQDWIENVLGSGSTYLVFKLVAVLMLVGGALYAVGLLDNVLNPLLSPLVGLFSPGN